MVLVGSPGCIPLLIKVKCLIILWNLSFLLKNKFLQALNNFKRDNGGE